MCMNYTANYVWNNVCLSWIISAQKKNRFGLVFEVGNIVWSIVNLEYLISISYIRIRLNYPCLQYTFIHLF